MSISTKLGYVSTKSVTILQRGRMLLKGFTLCFGELLAISVKLVAIETQNIFYSENQNNQRAIVHYKTYLFAKSDEENVHAYI